MISWVFNPSLNNHYFLIILDVFNFLWGWYDLSLFFLILYRLNIYFLQ